MVEDEASVRWLQNAMKCLYKNSPGCKDGGCADVQYADLLNFMHNAPSPPPSLQITWDQYVWRLQDEPVALYYLRCLANSCAVVVAGGGGGGYYCNASFLLDARASSFSISPDDGNCRSGAMNGLEQHVIRVMALRLVPSTTDIIQLGWSMAVKGAEATHHGATPSSSLGPAYCSRTHVVIQLAASGRHFSAWAYGDVGMRLRVGCVLSAVMYPSRSEDQEMAYVIHNVTEFTVMDGQNIVEPLSSAAAWPPDMGRDDNNNNNTKNNLFSSLPSQTSSFEQLVESFAPEIAGQTLCKSLLLLVAVHTMYRALRCRSRQPLHLLLLGASRSGKSALLHVFLRLLGSHATFVGAHVVHGQQRSLAMSQAISATYPHVRQRLFLGGAVSTFDVLVIDEISSRSCARLVEGFITGACPIMTGGVSASGGVSVAMLRGHVLPTDVQVTAAANDDLLAAATLIPQFALVARTTAQLSLRNTASIGEGVIAATVASSQSSLSSRTPSRSTSLCDGTPRRLDSMLSTGPLHEDALRTIVELAPPSSVLEAMIPAKSFYQFYMARLREHWSGGKGFAANDANHSILPLASLLSVLWELNLARLILEQWCCQEEATVGWTEKNAEEVWQCYKHHLWAVETATFTTTTSTTATSTGQVVSRCGDLPLARGGGRRKISKKALCVALLRMMAHEQRECGADAVTDASARAFFQQLGGETMTGQTFSDVIQHLLNGGFIIQRVNAYAVVGEV